MRKPFLLFACLIQLKLIRILKFLFRFARAKMRTKPAINQTQRRQKRTKCWLRNLTVKRHMTNDYSLIYFTSLVPGQKKTCGVLSVSCPISRILHSFSRFLSQIRHRSCENKEMSNVQPLISDLNAYNIYLINRKVLIFPSSSFSSSSSSFSPYVFLKRGVCSNKLR